MAGVADVVVGLVDLARALQRVGGRAVVLAEAAHVHVPEVERRLARVDPLGHHLADAARAREPVRAEAGGDEEAAHVRLAEAELVVGRERLRPVDEPRDRDVVHRRDALAGVDGDLLEALPVLLEQAAVEVGGMRSTPASSSDHGARCALVAAHHEAAALLAEVDEQVGVAQRRERVSGSRSPERLGDEVLVRHRDDRDAHAREPADLRRVHAAGVDDDLALDVARTRSRTAAHAAVARPRSRSRACWCGCRSRPRARPRPARR